MSSEIAILAGTAAIIGLTHTLLGPDHYLPFIVLSKARNWSGIKTVTITLLCGIGHILSSVVLGFIRLHILYHASKGPAFGLSLIKELETHGYRYRLSPGTIYPILHWMERNGFLFSEKAIINGKMRKYYRITEEGNKALSQVYEKVRELTNELNE